MSLITELKRRNVFRAGVAYLALGWLAVQATGAFAPAFGLPDWTLRLVLWLAIAGFPFVLVFAWVFELTPEGLRRDSGTTDRAARISARRLDYLTIALALMAIALMLFQYFGPGPDVESAPAQIATSAAGPGPELPPAAAGPAIPEHSIAVLAFANMSSDPEQEYFSDGIAEELLHRLAHIPELKVAARTSAFSFKGTSTAIPEIARQLGVAHVLEGSVRKSGEHVRITLQLIRAADGFHIWSEAYDRELEDIFAVQDEIARKVAGELELKLLGGSANGKQETTPEAYALVLRAYHLLNRGIPETMEAAVPLFRQALELDPQYARAWAGLAYCYNFQTVEGARPLEEGLYLSRDAAERALAIDPDDPKAHDALGARALTLEQDLGSAARHFARGLQSDPRDDWLNRGSAYLLAILGRYDESLAHSRFLLSIDPLNPQPYETIGLTHLLAGRLDDAIAAYRTALTFSPGCCGAHYYIGHALLLKGDASGALEEFRQEEPSSVSAAEGLALALHKLGRREESQAALARLEHDWSAKFPSSLAIVHAQAGNSDTAFEWLEKSIAQREPFLNLWVLLPTFAPLHDDPRWLPLLRRIGVAPEQLAAVEFNVEPPG